jgi:hypothetical protein
LEASIHLNLGVTDDNNVGDYVFLKLLGYLKEGSTFPLSELVYHNTSGNGILTRHLRFPAGACAHYLDTLLLRVDDKLVVEAREE